MERLYRVLDSATVKEQLGLTHRPIGLRINDREETDVCAVHPIPRQDGNSVPVSNTLLQEFLEDEVIELREETSEE